MKNIHRSRFTTRIPEEFIEECYTSFNIFKMTLGDKFKYTFYRFLMSCWYEECERKPHFINMNLDS